MTSAGPSNAPNFNITDDVPAAITGLTINCTPSGAATCGTNTSSGNTVSFSGASLNDGAGDQITITVSGTVAAGTTGNLTNTASIVIPGNAGFTDPNTANNSNDDVNIDPEPDIGPPDDNFYPLPEGSELIVDLGTPIVVSGVAEPAYDLVYYEIAATDTEIYMDWVVIEIGQTSTGPWYQVFYWGDYVPNTNSNVGGFIENDNEPILLAALYGTPIQTGITIDVDAPLIALGAPPSPPGYQFVRIYSPIGDPGGDGTHVDSLEVLP